MRGELFGWLILFIGLSAIAVFLLFSGFRHAVGPNPVETRPPIDARNICEMSPGDYSAHADLRLPAGCIRKDSAYDVWAPQDGSRKAFEKRVQRICSQ